MIKSQFLILALLIQIAAIFPSNSQACPLGANEQTLTVQRVMRNFGKYIGDADQVVLLGAKYPNEAITDAQITTAINEIALAMTCAEAVINNPSGDLLPSKTAFLTGDALKEYVQDYVDFMTEFHDALTHYEASFEALATQKASDRNWQSLYDESQKLNDLIDHAHKKMSDSPSTQNHTVLSTQANFSVTAGSLKQNMKAAEKDLRAIAATINDASKNQENAALAAEAAEYFQLTLSQVPEAVSDIPEDRQQAALQGYQAEINKAVALCVKLQQALLANDTATAIQTLKDLSEEKETGHGEYNP